MKKMIVAGVAASALLGGAAEAQALEWTETKRETVRTHTEAPNCSTPGDAVADAPTWARNLEAISPRPLLAVLLIVALLVLVVAFNVAIDLSMGCTTGRN